MSIRRQLELLHVPHSSYYYQPHTDPEKQRIDQNVKDEIVDIYLEKPFYGIRRITAELQQKGYKVNHKRVCRLRKATGLRTVYPRPRFSTSEPHPDHEVYPYLLKDLKIDHSNQVWATDITYTKVSGCKTFVIAIIAEVTYTTGTPGQNNPKPASLFGNHQLVKYGDKYYDPSYGLIHTSVQAIDDTLSGFYVTFGSDEYRFRKNPSYIQIQLITVPNTLH